MGLPKPPVELTDSCSVVYNSTLYSFSPTAFQAIDLQEGGTWKTLPSGIPVSGGACVKVVPSDDPNDASLFIIGGLLKDESFSNYTGLQRYSFASQKWSTGDVPDARNRQNHAAVYLNESSTILMYAGSTDGTTGLSSQTFTINATAPYGVKSYTSTAPPGISPMLMPWDESHAIMLGGSPDNTQIFTFDATSGWQNLGVVLPSGFHNQTTTACTILFGDDGSKILETYDMGVSPNRVSQLVLLGANGALAPTGQKPGSGSKLARRVSLQNFPVYNSSLAPTTIRSGFSVAQDDVTGHAVVSGGSVTDPFCIFDERSNTWMNATQILGAGVQQVSIQSTPTTSTSSSSSSSTVSAAAASSSTAAPAAAAAGPSKSRMLTVLGATLGAIFGIAAVLIIFLLLIRCLKQRRRRNNKDGHVEKEDRLSFADRGAEFMREAGGSASGHYADPRPTSHSSLAIMQGRIGGMGHKRGLNTAGSDSSMAHLVPMKKSPLGYGEPLEMSAIGEKLAVPEIKAVPAVVANPVSQQPVPPSAATQHGHSRSSGWSRYFSNNEATNLANMESARSTFASEQTTDGSQYTDSRIVSQPSQAPPPLDLSFTKFDGQRLSRVASGSPSVGHSREDLPGRPMQARLARAGSISSSSDSSMDEYDRAAATAAYQGETSAWTPVSRDAWNQRPPSSAYTDSNRVSALPSKDGLSAYPTDNKSSYYVKSGISTLYGFYGSKPDQERDSTVTVFPRGIPADDTKRAPSRGNGVGGPNQHSDMSWLNLGAGLG